MLKFDTNIKLDFEIDMCHPIIKIIGIGKKGISIVLQVKEKKYPPNYSGIVYNGGEILLIDTEKKENIKKSNQLSKKIINNENINRVFMDSSKGDKTQILETFINGSDMVFILCDFSEKVNVDILEKASEISRKLNILTVVIIEKNLNLKPKKEVEKIDSIIMKIKDAGSLIILMDLLKNHYVSPNNIIVSNNDLSRHFIIKIIEFIVLEGIICLDYADVKKLLEQSGYGTMFIGTGKGENKFEDATQLILTNKFINKYFPITRYALIHINMDYKTFSSSVLGEINILTEKIHDKLKNDCNIIFSIYYDKELNDEVCVTLILGGYSYVNENQNILSVNDDILNTELKKWAYSDENKPANIEVITLALKNGHKWIREKAVESLANYEKKEAIKLLLIALKDKSCSIRAKAIEVLGKFKGEQINDIIKNSLKDKSPIVRDKVIEVMKLKNISN